MKTLFLMMVGAGMFLAAAAFGQDFDPPEHDLHDPGHWYDYDCCSLQDCAPVPAHAVRLLGDGTVQIEIEPGEHPLVTGKTFRATISMDDPNFRLSQDGFHHVCMYPLHAYMGEVPEITDQDRLLCVYFAAAF